MYTRSIENKWYIQFYILHHVRNIKIKKAKQNLVDRLEAESTKQLCSKFKLILTFLCNLQSITKKRHGLS